MWELVGISYANTIAEVKVECEKCCAPAIASPCLMEQLGN